MRLVLKRSLTMTDDVQSAQRVLEPKLSLASITGGFLEFILLERFSACIFDILVVRCQSGSSRLACVRALRCLQKT